VPGERLVLLVNQVSDVVWNLFSTYHAEHGKSKPVACLPVLAALNDSVNNESISA